jgi:hypothetical protein
MALPALLVPTVIEAGIKVIERLFPDPNEAAKAKLALFELQQKGELANLSAEVEIATAQSKINEVEASGDIFRGGWRPAVGWICALGLSYQFIARPTMNFILALAGHGDIAMGTLELETLMTLLFGMLGLGWY